MKHQHTVNRSRLMEQLEGRTLLAVTIPGAIQAEYYNTGGEGVAYHDTTWQNKGGVMAFRASEGVDIEPTTDTGGGFDVCWTAPGEWIKYTVTAKSAGTYNISTRLASPLGKATFHIEIDGANATGAMSVPNTGGWQTYQTITRTGVNLAAGNHVLKLCFDTASNSSGMVGNFNWIQIAPATLTPYPGMLDTTFGSAGYAQDNAPYYLFDGTVRQLAVQTDGKILSLDGEQLRRFNASGTPDTAFGTGGSVIADAEYGPRFNTFAIQPDGRILMAGWTPGSMAIARYNTDGTSDKTFGTGGQATVHLGNEDHAGSMLVQPDGRIVVGGASFDAVGQGQYILARLNVGGALDTSFGTGGKVYSHVSSTSGFTSLALLPDGSIVGCGQTLGTTATASVLKYSSKGALLTTKSLTMPASSNIYTGEEANRLALTPDGKIVVAGTAHFAKASAPQTTWDQSFVLRLNPATLAPDATFHGGSAVLGSSGTSGQDVLVRSDGNIVLARGTSIVGYTAAGAVDTGFGTNGVVRNEGVGSALALAADGKILSGGGVWTNDSTSPSPAFVVERLRGVAPKATPFALAPLSISSPIQAEDFDNLGSYDATPANSGGKYRYTPVDIETCSDTGGGYDVNYTRPGEGLQYTVSVTTAKTYAFQTRLAALGTGGKFHITVDGVSLGSISIPSTGGWQTWKTVASGSRALTAGTHTIKLVMDTAGTSGFVANFNWMQLV